MGVSVSAVWGSSSTPRKQAAWTAGPQPKMGCSKWDCSWHVPSCRLADEHATKPEFQPQSSGALTAGARQELTWRAPTRRAALPPRRALQGRALPSAVAAEAGQGAGGEPGGDAGAGIDCRGSTQHYRLTRPQSARSRLDRAVHGAKSAPRRSAARRSHWALSRPPVSFSGVRECRIGCVHRAPIAFSKSRACHARLLLGRGANLEVLQRRPPPAIHMVKT